MGHTLYSCSGGILPINNSLLLTSTTFHSEVLIKPKMLLIKKNKIIMLNKVIIVLNTDPKNVSNPHL